MVSPSTKYPKTSTSSGGMSGEDARLLSRDVPGRAETWDTVGSNGEPESLFLLERHYDGTWLVKEERFLAPC